MRLFSAPPQLVKVARNSGVSRTTVSSGVEGATGVEGTGLGAGAMPAAGTPVGAGGPDATVAAAGPAFSFFGMKNSFHAKRISTEPRAANMIRLLSFKTYLPSPARSLCREPGRGRPGGTGGSGPRAAPPASSPWPRRGAGAPSPRTPSRTGRSGRTAAAAARRATGRRAPRPRAAARPGSCPTSPRPSAGQAIAGGQERGVGAGDPDLLRAGSRDHHQVDRRQIGGHGPKGLAHPALDSVPDHRVCHLARHRDADAGASPPRVEGEDHELSGEHALSALLDRQELAAAQEARRPAEAHGIPPRRPTWTAPSAPASFAPWRDGA